MRHLLPTVIFFWKGEFIVGYQIRGHSDDAGICGAITGWHMLVQRNVGRLAMGMKCTERVQSSPKSKRVERTPIAAKRMLGASGTARSGYVTFRVGLHIAMLPTTCILMDSFRWVAGIKAEHGEMRVKDR